jgi:hypothetical protein
MLPSIVIESLDDLVSTPGNDGAIKPIIEQHLQPLFDALWESAGYPGSPNHSPSKDR